MGYFFSLFSLSKSATNGALNWSELALLIFGIVLIVGLVGEYRTSDPHSRCMKFFEMLVIIGVLGELVGDGGIFLFSHQLQVISDNEILEANRNAGDAKSSAKAAAVAAARANEAAGNAQQKVGEVEKRADAITARLDSASRDIIAQGPRSVLLAKAAPELVNQLEPFAGQRVTLLLCGEPNAADQETTDTWAAIQNILGTDANFGTSGAKWEFVPTNVVFSNDCGGGQGLGIGLIVWVSKGASKKTMGAAKALSDGFIKTLPPSRDVALILVDPAWAQVFLGRGLSKKDPRALAGTDPDLVIVRIGAHPAKWLEMNKTKIKANH